MFKIEVFDEKTNEFKIVNIISGLVKVTILDSSTNSIIVDDKHSNQCTHIILKNGGVSTSTTSGNIDNIIKSNSIIGSNNIISSNNIRGSNNSFNNSFNNRFNNSFNNSSNINSNKENYYDEDDEGGIITTRIVKDGAVIKVSIDKSTSEAKVRYVGNGNIINTTFTKCPTVKEALKRIRLICN